MSSPYNAGPNVVISSSVPLDPTIIHERASENIQGGATGEHFHLTQIQHDNLTAYNGLIPVYEPLMAQGEIVSTSDGDCIMQKGSLYAT